MDKDKEYADYVDWVRHRAKRLENGYSHIPFHGNAKLIKCCEKPPALLAIFLDMCTESDGELYEHFVVDSLGAILGKAVDKSNVLMHGPCEGGFYDIEFPLCSEVLDEYPLWLHWAMRYQMGSIIVEAKNLAEVAGKEHVEQLRSYLGNNKKGRFGLLISRNGFTRPALQRMRCCAESDDTLILPLDQKDLKLLLRASIHGQKPVMKYLRRKVTSLLRVW